MSALAREHGAINLAQGFPEFDGDEALKDLVCRYIKDGFNQYAPMPGVPLLNERIAALIQEAYDADVHPGTEITVCAGATEGIFSVITALVHPGEEVIIIEPAYDSYRPAITLCGAKTVAIQTKGPLFKIDWDELRASIKPNTKLLIVNTPHNPTGTCFDAEDMNAICGIVEDFPDLFILSDEVYEHIVFDGRRHESVLRYPELWGRCIAAASFGKTFHLTGWRLGYVVAAEPIMREIRKVHQYVNFSIHTASQYALADYLETSGPWKQLGTFYQAKRDYFEQAMAGSPFKLLPSAGTFFQLADYSAVSDLPDLELAKLLTREYGVATIPLSPFYTQAPTDGRYLRFCFAKHEATLDAAAAKLKTVKL
jgi:methionine aminotransferase